MRVYCRHGTHHLDDNDDTNGGDVTDHEVGTSLVPCDGLMVPPPLDEHPL
jgi:hypothetical protein